MLSDHRRHLHRTATGTAVEAADIALSERLSRHRHHPVVQGLAAANKLADQMPLLGLSAAVLLFGWGAGDRRAVRAGTRMAAALGAAAAGKYALKKLVSRTRPNVLHEHGRYEVEPLGPDTGPWHSFPSGHTAGSVAVARAAAREYPGAAVPLLGTAGAVGAAQLPLGAHHLSDVLAGLAVGLAAEAATDRVLEALARRRGPLGRLARLVLPRPPGVQRALAAAAWSPPPLARRIERLRRLG